MELLLKVNGTAWEISARPTARLIDVLRNQMGLTGTKEGCGEGECGACTVIVDGKAVNSCVMLAVQALGKEVLTVEGLAASGELDTLQQKFVEQGAVQCGFCTPGMLMSAKALLMANPLPSDQDIRKALAGNLCRCTGYKTIVAAVRAASGQETAAMEVPAEKEELLADLSVPGLAAPAPDVDAAGPASAPPRREGGE
ncbi:MAG TPA: (2Fe-2S)-binding protein [Thermoleophilia bacterium]|nr:(2Fe-2S)-binding protein [Thermoleophilia bacterium]